MGAIISKVSEFKSLAIRLTCSKKLNELSVILLQTLCDTIRAVFVMKRIGNALTSSQPPKKTPAEEQATPSNGAQKATAKQAQTPQAQVNSAASLRKALNQCMMRDRFRLSKRISGASKIKKDAARNAVFDEIALDIAKSMMVAEQRSSYKPTIEYPETLPVSQKRDDIAKAIEENQVVIVAGETGSGKTTQLPKICAELGRGKFGLIGHTQPRRLAARSLPTVLPKRWKPSLVSLLVTRFDSTIRSLKTPKSN